MDSADVATRTHHVSRSTQARLNGLSMASLADVRDHRVRARLTMRWLLSPRRVIPFPQLRSTRKSCSYGPIESSSHRLSTLHNMTCSYPPRRQPPISRPEPLNLHVGPDSTQTGTSDIPLTEQGIETMKRTAELVVPGECRCGLGVDRRAGWKFGS